MRIARLVCSALLAMPLLSTVPAFADDKTQNIPSLIQACLNEATAGHTLSHKNPPSYLVLKHRTRMREICNAWKTVVPNDIPALQADCEKEATRFSDRYSFDILRVRKHAEKQREICRELGSARR